MPVFIEAAKKNLAGATGRIVIQMIAAVQVLTVSARISAAGMGISTCARL